jgi:hypothetical protein
MFSVLYLNFLHFTAFDSLFRQDLQNKFFIRQDLQDFWDYFFSQFPDETGKTQSAFSGIM